MSEIKSANNLCSFFLQLVLIRIYLANIQFISVIFHPLNYNKTENPSKDALQKAETLKKLQITQNDQTDLGDQTDQTDQTNRGGARTVTHAKLPISSFDQSVSESETIISARDTGASEKNMRRGSPFENQNIQVHLILLLDR